MIGLLPRGIAVELSLSIFFLGLSVVSALAAFGPQAKLVADTQVAGIGRVYHDAYPAGLDTEDWQDGLQAGHGTQGILEGWDNFAWSMDTCISS